MDTRAAVVNRLLELTENRGWTINALATNAGVSASTIKSIINGTSRNPGIVTIKKLCDAFEITLDQFFATDEFRSLEQEIK